MLIAEIVFIADYWADCELILYCNKEDLEALGKEHTLALINHKYEIDWLFGWSFLSKIGTLGNTRGFIKKIIKYIPFAGWFFGLADHVFLERSFEKDKKTIEEQLTKYMEYKSSAWVSFTIF